MELREEHVCVICEARETRLVHRGTRDNDAINVYECLVCGTKFLDKIAEYDYENDYMYQTNNMSNIEIQDRLKLFHVDDERRYHMVKHIVENKKVLDFGCGFGGFLNEISGVADNIYGVELGRNEREYLISQGISCKKCIDEYEEKFDVITLFHTFEHLSDPRFYLKKFSQYLNPGGRLIIEVPNANDVLLSLYGSEKFADFTYWSAHLYLYTSESLSMLIKEFPQYKIISASQIQRYSIANHLLWLSKGVPGGHEKWNFMDARKLNLEYEKKLRELGMCDTLFFEIQCN